MKQMSAILAVLLIFGLATLSGCGTEEDAADVAPATETAVTAEVENAKGSAAVQAYYFHGSRRCKTCLKIESLATKAIAEGFADALAEGQISWQVVDFEEEGNEHFVDDFGLYTQSVVLVKPNVGDTASWNNLEKVWDLVHDDQAFIEYVQTEVNTFLGGH